MSTDPELLTELLAAAKAWRTQLIPNMSSSGATVTWRLVDAIAAIEACAHPRAQRVFYAGTSRETCGKCGEPVDA